MAARKGNPETSPWRSPTNEMRRSKISGFTLTEEEQKALAKLVKRLKLPRSRVVGMAILALASSSKK